MKIFHLIKRFKEFWDRLGLAWQIAGAIGLTGFVVAAVSAFWAAVKGIPAPFILMGVFCVLVVTTQLVLSWLIYQVVTRPVTAGVTTPLDYKPIRLQHQYSLLEASRLWAGLSPDAPASTKSKAWCNSLTSAIQQGELKFEPRFPSNSYAREQERRAPTLATRIAREELRRYAASIDEHPEFLKDE